MKLRKTLLISFLLLTAFSLAAGQPSQPLNVYGTVTDSPGGEAVADAQVEAIVDGSAVSSATTNSDGFYDLYVSEASSGDQVSLEVDGISTGETVDYEPGKVVEVNLEEDLIEEDNESEDTSGGGSGSGSDGGSGGGGLGSLPSGGNDTDEESQGPVRNVTAEVSDGTASTTVDSVEANESVTVSIPDEGNVNSVESVSFSVSDSSSNVDVSVTELSEKPDEVKEPSTRTYRYQQIQVTPSEGTVSSAKINFKVSKQEIDDRQVSLADVVMQRYSEGGWQELPTRLSGETDTHYRFVATSEGFSYYAITFADDGTDDQQQNETTGNQTDETREEPETDTELILYLLGLMVLAGLVAVYGFREQIDDFVASLVSEKD